VLDLRLRVELTLVAGVSAVGTVNRKTFALEPRTKLDLEVLFARWTLTAGEASLVRLQRHGHVVPELLEIFKREAHTILGRGCCSPRILGLSTPSSLSVSAEITGQTFDEVNSAQDHRNRESNGGSALRVVTPVLAEVSYGLKVVEQ